MANWKKVLVSGSSIDVAQITSSVLPGGSDSDKVVVIDSTTGGFKQVSQEDIQGTTVANFTVIGNGGSSATFDATAHTMSFEGRGGATVDVTQIDAITNVKFNMPDGTISSSAGVILDETTGYTSFSSSLAADIATNLSEIGDNETSITSLQQEIDNLILTASKLTESSASLSSSLGEVETTASNLDVSINALNDATSSFLLASDTGSFVVSASVIGTTDEIEVSANGAQGIQIGLPTDVTLDGSITANDLKIVGYQPNGALSAIVSGHTQFGDDPTDVHNFTGSLNITGALNIDSTNANITFQNVTVDNTLTPTDLIVVDSNGVLKKAGTAVQSAISGAFDAISASLASDLAAIDTTGISDNSDNITNLQTTSQSLVDSASLGVFFKADGGTGNAVSLGESASFIAAGTGLSVDHADNGNGNASITYTIDHQAIGDAIGAFSQSSQLQDVLDDIYVNLSDAPISGAQQLIDLGFLTSSNFDQLEDVPAGLISGAATGDAQGQIKFNNATNVTINNLGTDGTPTFASVTVTGDLTVKGTTTSLEVDNVNIEDQFILINSGAGGDNEDKDGGIIVDNGGGAGALLYYDFTNKNWGFVGATTNDVPYNQTSADGGAVIGEVFIGTVSSSAVNPTVAPLYGNGDYQKGQMHINTADDTIWVYA